MFYPTCISSLSVSTNKTSYCTGLVNTEIALMGLPFLSNLLLLTITLTAHNLSIDYTQANVHLLLPLTVHWNWLD